MTGVVDRNRLGFVVAGPTEIPRVNQSRVDHQGVLRPVRTELEAVRGLAEDLEAPGDSDALAVDLLVHARRTLLELAEGCHDDEGTVLGDAQSVDAAIRDLNLARICAGPDDELLLEMTTVAEE